MILQYSLIPAWQTPEDCEGECEWGTFLSGYDCSQPLVYALVDMESEDKFHAAHLCIEHGGVALALSNVPPTE